MLQELRHAARNFARNPGFAALALCSLALGIGANTAIYSLLDRVILRSLPVKDPSHLVIFKDSGPRVGSVLASYDSDYSFSYPLYRDFRDRAPDLDGVITWFSTDASVAFRNRSSHVPANLVSGNFFDSLGVGTILGRPISPEDDRVGGASPVTVLGYAFWVKQFGGDRDVLNQRLIVNGTPMTVVGVAVPGFNGLSLGEAPALYVPMATESQMLPGRSERENRRANWLNIAARLGPGLKPAAAEAALNSFVRPILEAELSEIPQASQRLRQEFLKRHLVLVPAGGGISALRDRFGTPLFFLMGFVGLVLLIACANVANLMLARAAGRQREISIRLALGARRVDIARQVIAESVLLSATGAALGILLASWAGRPLLSMLPFTGITDAIATDPDPRVLAFTAAISMLSAALFGLAPVIQSLRLDVAPGLKQQPAGAVGSLWYRKTLVVAQVTLSMLLLVGAGLFARTLQNLKTIDPGFRADHLLAFAIDPSLNGYDEPRARSLYTRLIDRFSGTPGVTSATLATIPLLTGSDWMSGIQIPDRQARDTDLTPDVDLVGPGYFSAIGIPLMAGREFLGTDGADSSKVAIVNQAFERMYFENQNPVGRTFVFSASRTVRVEIIGVAKDSHYTGLTDKIRPFIFCPYLQRSQPGGATFYLRTRQTPESMAGTIRREVHEADPNLPIFDVKTMDQQIDESVYAQRMISRLSVFFGLLAALLAAVGIYGVLSFLVTRRTREIGIRMALGADRSSVLRLVFSEAALLFGAGIAIALPASIPLTRLAQSLLFGVGAHDPVVIAGAVVMLALIALLAASLPAARAARVDPVRAMRQE